ncbi:MAG: glycosyltransferase [Rhodobacteraceae bacterium]|nr:glycosyltransferase [Paracoccaceae bacterium]
MTRPPLTLAATGTGGASAGSARPRIGEILAARGVVTRDQVEACLKRQVRMQARLGDLLRMDLGVSESEVRDALEAQCAARHLDLRRAPPDPFLVRAVGLEHCLATRTLPWRRIGGATVIAAVYPDSYEAHRARYEAVFGPVMLALVTQEDLTACLARLFPAEIRQRSECRVPEAESCRSWAGEPFRAGLAATGLGLAALAISAPAAAFLLLTCVALLALTAQAGLKASAALTAHRRAEPTPHGNVLPLHPSARLRQPVVSLLVPLFHEERIADRLLSRLGRLKYPRALLDICLVVESDDVVTRKCLLRTSLPPHVRTIVVPPGSVRTKPRALNYALDNCHGSIIGVYDAEDAPCPDQIAHVVSRFAEAPADVACLQGRLSFYNARHNWLSRCFAIDYAIWFGVVLPGISRLGIPIPLGGTTLFFRRETLESLGGWDAFNVTEDADLGIRLARRGYRTELIDSTTQEEANARLWPWVRQRSRWLKGYAMTYASHMRDPRRLWRDLGPRGFLGFQVMFLGSLLQVTLAPLLWTWWLISFGLPHPLTAAIGMPGVVAATGLLIASEAVNIILAVLALRRTGQTWLLPWIAVLNPYFMLATLAAYRALAELVYRPFFWDKTEHGVALEDDRASP